MKKIRMYLLVSLVCLPVVGFDSFGLSQLFAQVEDQPKDDNDASTESDSEASMAIPSGGIPIPKEMKQIRERFDKNKDGKLSQEEFDAMPQQVKKRIKEAVQSKMSAKEELPPLKLPPEGIVLPDELKRVRDRGDKNNDGKLTQDELDAMPDAIRQRVEIYFRQQQSGKKNGEVGDTASSPESGKNTSADSNANNDSAKKDVTDESIGTNSNSWLWTMVAVVGGAVLLLGIFALRQRKNSNHKD